MKYGSPSGSFASSWFVIAVDSIAGAFLIFTQVSSAISYGSFFKTPQTREIRASQRGPCHTLFKTISDGKLVGKVCKLFHKPRVGEVKRQQINEYSCNSSNWANKPRWSKGSRRGPVLHLGFGFVSRGYSWIVGVFSLGSFAQGSRFVNLWLVLYNQGLQVIIPQIWDGKPLKNLGCVFS